MRLEERFTSRPVLGETTGDVINPPIQEDSEPVNRTMSGRRIVSLAVPITTFVLVVSVLGPCAKRKAESVQCGNQMASIGSAALLWAEEHNGSLPSELLGMSNYLGTTRILFCPGDHSHKLAESWASFTPSQSSYEIVSSGLRAGDTNAVFLRCKVHGHIGYADATVFDGVRRRTKKIL
jgi:hypothetical protein